MTKIRGFEPVDIKFRKNPEAPILPLRVKQVLDMTFMLW